MTTTQTPIRKGVEFTHLHFLDPAWRPGPGERYADGPRRRMVITKATADVVYYAPAGETRGQWYLTREVFEERYGAQIAAQTAGAAS